MSIIEHDGKYFELLVLSPVEGGSSVECVELSNPNGVCFGLGWHTSNGLVTRYQDGPAPDPALMSKVQEYAAKHLGDTIIDFYAGSDGPTILMKCLSVDAVRRLTDAIASVRDGGPAVEVSDFDEVRMLNFEGLYMSLSDFPRSPRLTKAKDGPRFHWCCTAEEWDIEVERLQVLAVAERGHQYLSDDAGDAAVIEVSLREPGVGDAMLDEV